jgi:signal transduction histidine kinase
MSHPHGVPGTSGDPGPAVLEGAGQILRALLDGMPDAVTVFALDTSESVYPNVAARMLPEDVRAFLNLEALRGRSGNGPTRRRILELLDAAGKRWVFESMDYPIGAITAGRPLMVHFARDVTTPGRPEQPEQQDQHLPRVGAMAAGLAHEIRTPLTSISNGAAALRDMIPGLDGDARLAIDIIAKEAARAAALLTDFLCLARPRPPRLEAHDLDRLVAEAVVVALRSRPQAEAVAVQVRAGAKRVEALVDAGQMMQALLNVIVNALDACLEGRSGRERRVEVRLAPPAEGERFCRVTVLDTGPGIAPEDRPHVFEPFFSRKRGGTGLGLAITRRIVEGHGGRLEVEEAPGGGAAFALHVPAAGPLAS